jgi:hypothetical protein
MNKMPGLIVMAVILAAGCVGQSSGVIQNILTVDVVKGGVEDITITAKVPEFARAENDFNWQLIAEPAVTVKNIDITVYDRCVFQPVKMAPEENCKIAAQDVCSLPEIWANNTQIITLTYHTPAVGFERTCPVMFTANYLSNATMSTTVAVLQEVEYMQRKAADKLGEIPIKTFTSLNPLQLQVSWGPEGQPLLHLSSNQLHIDYSNAGTGTISRLEPGQVVITVPANMGDTFDCDDYRWDASTTTLTLSRQLDFVRNKAKRSTCTFIAKASQPIDSQSLVITAAYRYSIDGQVSIPLLAR